MTDLLIINPGAASDIYGALADSDLVAIEPPLWARLIAGYIRDRGFSVKIIDAEAERLDAKQIAARVLHDPPRLACIAAYGHQPSASTQQMHGAGICAKMIKGCAPDMPIIMVGGHVAALPERTLREENIDFACNGEGPETIAGLLDYLGGIRFDLSTIPGLVWYAGDRRTQRIIINRAADLLDVNDIHGDAWDLLPMHLYRAHNWQCFGDLSQRQPYASIYTSLGCPYKCSFCCIQSPFSPDIHGNRYRMRDAEQVVDEIKMLHETYGISTIKIIDELFVLNRKHYTAICRGIIDAGLVGKLNIWAYARVDTVHPENLDLLRRAGVKWLALGIESGSKYVRDGADKALKNDDIIGVVRGIQSAGINVIGNYIFGLPDDDYQSMRDTLALAVECNTEFANFYSAMAYPGSALYTDAISRGIILPESWSGYSQHSYDCRPLDTHSIGAPEVLAFRDQAFQEYFSGVNYINLVSEKFGSDTVGHVKDMTSRKIARKLLESRLMGAR